MKVALLVHTFMQADAIGNAAQLKLRAMSDAEIECHAFALGRDPDLGHLSDSVSRRTLRANPFMLSASIRILEFGWYTPLARFVTHAPGSIRTAVYFHGITPQEYIPPHLRSTARATCQQVRSLRWVDRVFCSSNYAKRMLEANGVDPKRITILPLPIDLPRRGQPRRASLPIRILWVGRMVSSKGLLDLIDALRQLKDRASPEWRLRIITAARLQDPAYAGDVQRAIDAAGLRERIGITYNVADRDVMAGLYAESDIVAIPSYHDSYCLPLLEGFASGCAVVAYDSGVIAENAAGLARLVRRGDVAGFADTLFEALTAAAEGAVPTDAHGRLLRDDFRRRALAKVADLKPAAFARQFIEALKVLERQPPMRMRPDWQRWMRSLTVIFRRQ